MHKLLMIKHLSTAGLFKRFDIFESILPLVNTCNRVAYTSCGRMAGLKPVVGEKSGTTTEKPMNQMTFHDPPKGWKKKYGYYFTPQPKTEVFLSQEFSRVGSEIEVFLCASHDGEPLMHTRAGRKGVALFRADWLRAEFPQKQRKALSESGQNSRKPSRTGLTNEIHTPVRSNGLCEVCHKAKVKQIHHRRYSDPRSYSDPIALKSDSDLDAICGADAATATLISCRRELPLERLRSNFSETHENENR